MTDPYAAPASYGNPPLAAAPAGAGGSKIGPIAGICFVALFVAGFLFFGSEDTDAPDAKWVAFWQDKDNRVEGTVTSILMMLAAGAFLWFLGGLRRRLAGAVG